MTTAITIYRSTHSSHDDPTWHITYRHPELNDPLLVRFVKRGRDRCLLRCYARWDGEKWDPDRWVPTQPVVPRWLIQLVEQALREGGGAMTAAFIQHRMSPEEMVRTVLEAGLTVSATELARRCGVSREAVRQIRYGKLHAKVLPHLPRPGVGTGSRRCWQCRLGCRTGIEAARAWWGKKRRFEDAADDVKLRRREAQSPTSLVDPLWCSIGYPESIDPTYARECPAFEPIE